ncbi:hypothetical protein AB0A70_25330 [Streptomyces morookaense]|uniref:hypothetical protein n=1 Tax=Streptomyces morookaense TaxID=1970 RepID=UPI0033DA592A
MAALEQHIEPDSQAAGRIVDDATEAAAKGLREWATGAGLTAALNGWRSSVKALEARLSAEKAALAGTNRLFLGTDGRIGSQFSAVSPLQQSRLSEY